MDIKSMLVKVAEEQADKMKEQAVGYTQSNEFAEVVQDLIAGIFKK